MKKVFKKSIIIFSILFIITFILSMLTGGFGKKLNGMSAPLSLREMVQYIPEIIIFSFIFTLFTVYFSRKE